MPSRLNAPAVLASEIERLKERVAFLESLQHEASSYVDGLSADQRLAAIKAVCPDAEVKRTDTGYRMHVPRLFTSRGLREEMRTWGLGATPAEAIDSMWFWLTSPEAPWTHEGSPVQRAQNAIIVPLGAPQNQWPTGGDYECWLKWNGWMWWPICVQRCGEEKWLPLDRGGLWLSPEDC